jgi:hypothetical protein
MNKLNLNQAFQLLGNISVVIGIIFLVIEIGQNNESLNAQTRAMWVDRQAGILEAMAFNPEFVDLMKKDFDTLTPNEQSRVLYMGHRTLVVWESQYDEMIRGRLDETDVISLQKAVFGDFGTRSAWERYRNTRAKPGYADWFKLNIINAN